MIPTLELVVAMAAGYLIGWISGKRIALHNVRRADITHAIERSRRRSRRSTKR